MIAIAFPFRNKVEVVARVENLREAGELVRGGGRGQLWGVRHSNLLVGRASYHQADPCETYARITGIPVELVLLNDWLFEHLPENHLEWPLRFTGSIAEGADLTSVHSQWMMRLLTRCIGYCGAGEESWRVCCRDAVADTRNAMAAGGCAEAPRGASAAGIVGAALAARAVLPAPILGITKTVKLIRGAEAAETMRTDLVNRAAGAVGAARAVRAAQAVQANETTKAAWWAARASYAAEVSGTEVTCDAEIRCQADDLVELLQTAGS